MVAVEPRGRHGGNEELRAIGAVDLAVGAAAQAGVGHGQQIRLVELERRVDLVVEVIARAAGAGAQRATALDHEILDDAVEGEAIVEGLMAWLAGERIGPLLLAAGQAEEVLHGLRCLLVEQIDLDITFGGVHDNSAHSLSP